MFKDWFKQKYSVCKECEVHFEPVSSFDARWGDLCKQHRQAVKERDLKRDAVMQWAGDNWERLYEQYEKETAETRAKYRKAMENMQGMGLQNALAAQQQAMPQPRSLGNIFGY